MGNMNNMTNEIWKDIPGYEGLYMVSNLGNVKSLDRIINCRGDIKRFAKGIPMKLTNAVNGYFVFNINKEGKRVLTLAHQAVAMAFLGHKPNKFEMVVNHINFDKHDNRVENLELVTNRQNSNKKHLASSSKYVGVSKSGKSWKSCLEVNKKTITLGIFDNEIEASEYYQNALKSIEKGDKIKIKRFSKISKSSPCEIMFVQW